MPGPLLSLAGLDEPGSCWISHCFWLQSGINSTISNRNVLRISYFAKSKPPRVSQLMRNWSKSIHEKQLSPELFAWYPGCVKTGTYIDTIHHSPHGKINDTFSIRKQKQVGSQNSVSRNFQKPVNTVEGASSAVLCVTRHLFITQLWPYGTLHKPGFNERRKHNFGLWLDRFHGEITPSLLCLHC